VLRVRRPRGHLGVSSRRREPLVGERRRIVKVYQIMGDPRMLGWRVQIFSRIAAPLELIGIGLVGR